MNIWSRFFNKQEETKEGPIIRFGRYSDSYKSAENYQAWDDALLKFEHQDYLGCFRDFFRYLRDDSEDNVKYRETDKGIEFELFQGSKKIFGFADNSKLTAEAKIAKANGSKISFMQRLLEQNFDLKYSRFALDEEGNLTIIFDTYSLDGSPYKLYYALKELAINADKQDDLLLDEFKSLEQVGTNHLQPLPSEEKSIKYQYIYSAISDAEKVFQDEKMCQEFPGGVAYFLLNLLYKLDYLIKPEGYMMEVLERANRLYFAKDNKTTYEKIHMLWEELHSLSNRPKSEFFKEMYRGISTFGITAPVSHGNVVNLINNDLGNMDWYMENGYEEIAISIPGYIIGYSLFNYAVPKPDKELFHLYFQIIEAEYFKKLGYGECYYDPENTSFKQKEIKRAIDQIVAFNKENYIHLAPNTAMLNFNSLAKFARSYLLMIKDLDLT